MAFYKASEKFGMECMQLTPAFDIDLFAEPDNEEYNMVGDEMENPFFGTAPAGTQQMTLVSGYNWPTYDKFFTMSTEFDKNISDWRYDCTDHKN